MNKIDDKNKGLGYELICLKLLSEITKVQKDNLKKYIVSNGYTSFKLRVGKHQYYEQDVMIELKKKYGILKPFYKFFQSFRNIHSTKNLITQCKNYDGTVDAAHIDHDLVQIGMGGILGFNIPVNSVIVMDDNNKFTEYKFKRKYHILDIVENKDFDISYLDKDYDFINSNSHFVALKDFGKIKINYRTIKDINEVSLDDIVTYINDKKTKKIKFEKHRLELGNLFLVLHKKKLQFVNIIKYSNNVSKNITTVNTEKMLKNIIASSWKFLNPELVFYLTEKGITKKGMDHINRVGANHTNLFGLIQDLENGKILKKNKFIFDVNHDLGRKMSANLEIRFLDSVENILNGDKFKKLTKKEWNKAYDYFAYHKIKKSNFSLTS